MPTVKYVANASPQDGTSAIKLEGERFLHLGGDPIKVSDEEFAQLNGLYQLEEVSDEEATPAPTGPITAESPVTGATASVNPVAPQRPSIVFPVSPPTDPSTTSPPEGN